MNNIKEKKSEENNEIKIIDYNPSYKNIFRELNIEWISKFFKMEPSDYKSLDNPDEYIINKGGFIFIALYKNEPLGVCALIKMDNPKFQYELAKMAVSPKAQGKNLGFLLATEIIKKAKYLGASNIYLESNTILTPAINLYKKVGFKKIDGIKSPYERCNIQMELKLK